MSLAVHEILRARMPPALAALIPFTLPSAQVPVLTERARLEASAGAPGDHFGTSLSLDDETLAVGAALAACGYGCGVAGLEEVYVFEPDGSGWGERTRLDALDTRDGTSGNGFGASIALDGDTLVVGAPFQDGIGAAHVFVRAGTGWVEQAKLVPSIPFYLNLFGLSVALERDTAVIGAWGSASVFVRNGTTWTQEAELSESAHSAFGYSVSLSEETLIIGAPDLHGCGHFGCDNPGAAYVYGRDGALWSLQSELYLPRGNDDDLNSNHFGFSVAVDGDTLLVGTPGFDRFLGAAHVYSRHAGGWNEQARLVSSQPLPDASFGHAVALDGATAVIGTSGYSDTSAHVFVRDGASWSAGARLVSSGSGTGLDFGSAVALDGCTALVGAPQDLAGGSVRVFAVQPAHARFRNAGTNPASYTANAPLLGGAFTASVDLATTGHGVAVLFGFQAPASIPLGGGQVLLCGPVGGSHELLGRPAAVGPTATFRFAIPDDLALCGYSLSTQAALLGVGLPFALTNAQDLVVGTF